MEPTIKRIRLSTPYLVHPDTKQMYSLYKVVARWPDGTRKEFDSEEHLNAFMEERSVSQANIEAETPLGFIAARDALLVPDKKPDEQAPNQQSDFDVVVTGFTESKVAVIKVLRTLIGQGLKECKEIVDNLPAVIQEQTSKENADNMKAELEAAGATVELR